VRWEVSSRVGTVCFPEEARERDSAMDAPWYEWSRGLSSSSPPAPVLIKMQVHANASHIGGRVNGDVAAARPGGTLFETFQFHG
jgi:hypothetical protein